MFQKIVISLVSLLLFVSCDKRPNSTVSDTSRVPQRSTRADRLSRDVPGTREKLRSAFEAAKAIAPGEERESALAEVAKKALESAPDLAAEIIVAMSAGGDEKKSLIAAYIQKLMEEGKTDEAVTWADSLGDEVDIGIARSVIAQSLVSTDPEKAADMLSASSFSTVGIDPTAEQVLESWIATNPTQAAAWVSRLPAGEARGAGLKSLISTWINMDSGNAFSWVATQRNTIIREEAVEAVVAALIGQPEPIRNIQLETADKDFQQEIGQRIAELTPAPEPEPEPETEAPQEPDSSNPPLQEPESSPEPESDLETEP